MGLLEKTHQTKGKIMGAESLGFNEREKETEREGGQTDVRREAQTLSNKQDKEDEKALEPWGTMRGKPGVP